MNGSLRGPGAARTVLLRMAQDEARAQRIRQLKADHPEKTWGYIADQVGVKERSAIAWQSTGGVTPENAKKLAAVFDVTYEWLWFGEKEEATPELLAKLSSGDQVEDIRDEFRRRVDTLDAKLDLILSLLGEEALQAGARELTEIDPDEASALAALAKARSGKGPRRPSG